VVANPKQAGFFFPLLRFIYSGSHPIGCVEMKARERKKGVNDWSERLGGEKVTPGYGIRQGHHSHRLIEL